jgi:hypothetical protein
VDGEYMRARPRTRRLALGRYAVDHNQSPAART